MVCLLIEYMEYRAWHKRRYGYDCPVEYKTYLEVHGSTPHPPRLWIDE